MPCTALEGGRLVGMEEVVAQTRGLECALHRIWVQGCRPPGLHHRGRLGPGPGQLQGWSVTESEAKAKYTLSLIIADKNPLLAFDNKMC